MLGLTAPTASRSPCRGSENQPAGLRPATSARIPAFARRRNLDRRKARRVEIAFPRLRPADRNDDAATGFIPTETRSTRLGNGVRGKIGRADDRRRSRQRVRG